MEVPMEKTPFTHNDVPPSSNMLASSMEGHIMVDLVIIDLELKKHFFLSPLQNKKRPKLKIQ
jgi:hypothetical protein